jgi:hypothetical protein
MEGQHSSKDSRHATSNWTNQERELLRLIWSKNLLKGLGHKTIEVRTNLLLEKPDFLRDCQKASESD